MAIREDAHKAFDAFLEKCAVKYPKACDGLRQDRDVLLTFYDSPAEIRHWNLIHQVTVDWRLSAHR